MIVSGLNINGRVPDEGAMVEAGIAWNAGKHVVIYKSDSRTLLNGNDNPLLLGLSDFETTNEINEIPEIFKSNSFESDSKIDNKRVKHLYSKGRKIYEAASTKSDASDLCMMLIEVLEGGYVHAV